VQVTTEESGQMMARIDRLERRLRVLGLVSVVSAVAAMSAITLPSAKAQGQPQVVRARGLIIVDEQDRDRIVIGSPVPDPKEGKRLNPSTGMVINDINGYERFGLGLTQDNRMGMGFDAPPGKGDDRNRERINIVADDNGGAYLRFLNRKTGVVGRLMLDATDQFYLEFLDFPEGKVLSRRIGFKGEQTVELPR
jgi:hypothetical protein